MATRRITLFLIQACAVFAYMTCVLQWMLLLAVYAPVIIDSDIYQAVMPQVQSPLPQPVAPAEPALPLPLLIVIASVVVVLMIGLTVMTLARAPKAIGQTGQKVARGAAEAVVPIVHHHRPLKPTERKRLTARVVFTLKCIVVILPVLGALVVAPLDQIAGLTREMLLLVTGLLGGWALLLFVLQLVLARLGHIPYEKIW